MATADRVLTLAGAPLTFSGMLMPALVFLIGAIVWLLPIPYPKVCELGRIAAEVGLLWLVYLFAHSPVHLG